MKNDGRRSSFMNEGMPAGHAANAQADSEAHSIKSRRAALEKGVASGQVEK